MALPRKNQFSGCLVGQCLGDALGTAVKGRPPEICKAYVDEIVRPKRLDFLQQIDFKFGQYNCDSRLAREMFQSYVELNSFSLDNCAERIATISLEDQIGGSGRPTGESASESNEVVFGAGSARAAPVGLMLFDDPDEMVRVANDQAIISHSDFRCAAGSVAVAGAVALAVQSERIENYEFISRLCEWVGKIHPIFAAYIRELPRWLELPIDQAALSISETGISPPHSSQLTWISPYVISSVMWSLYSFLNTPDDYFESICNSISVGGDVETAAAIAGSIGGAYNGLEKMPLGLAIQLSDQGKWGYSELVELAHRAYDIKLG